MDHLIKKVDYLPHPPKEFLDELGKIAETRTNHHWAKAYEHIYANYNVDPRLEEFYQQFFDYPITCRYQVINGSLRPHQDIGPQFTMDNMWKYNYIFKTGGAITSWWDDELQCVYSIECEANQWYHLNVMEFHSVTKPDETRYSLTIKRKE